MTGLSREELQAASDFLMTLWRDGQHAEAVPMPFRPKTRDDGYAVQALCEKHSAHPLFGWKIAATSEAGQRHINVDGPLAGRLLRETVMPLGRPVAIGANRMRVAEIEFAFRMGRSLIPRSEPYRMADVVDAVASLHLAVEIPDSRFTDFVEAGAAQIIADNACAHRFVLGPEVTANWRERDLPAHVVQGRTAQLVHDGRGANVLGDPRLALTWLANELSTLEIALREGEIVTTGTCVVPIPIAPGDVVTGDYGDFGTIEVQFV
jgi:2-keto-4-pentenoate hydratase